MPAVRLRSLLALLFLLSCSKARSDGGLLAKIEIDARLKPTCIVLELRASPSGPVLADAKMPASSGKTTYEVGIGQNMLPKDISLRARAATGTLGCMEPLSTIAQSSDASGTFVTGTIKEVTLSIGCSSAERCDDGADDDCDGMGDCADSDCMGSSCGGGRTCVAGGCLCPSTQRACDGGCVASGACCSDAECASVAGQTCTSGACACPAGQKACAGACI